MTPEDILAARIDYHRSAARRVAERRWARVAPRLAGDPLEEARIRRLTAAELANEAAPRAADTLASVRAPDAADGATLAPALPEGKEAPRRPFVLDVEHFQPRRRVRRAP